MQARYGPERLGHFGLALADLRPFHLADPPLCRPARPPRAGQRLQARRGRAAAGEERNSSRSASRSRCSSGARWRPSARPSTAMSPPSSPTGRADPRMPDHRRAAVRLLRHGRGSGRRRAGPAATSAQNISATTRRRAQLVGDESGETYRVGQRLELKAGRGQSIRINGRRPSVGRKKEADLIVQYPADRDDGAAVFDSHSVAARLLELAADFGRIGCRPGSFEQVSVGLRPGDEPAVRGKDQLGVAEGPFFLGRSRRLRLQQAPQLHEDPGEREGAIGIDGPAIAVPPKIEIVVAIFTRRSSQARDGAVDADGDHAVGERPFAVPRGAPSFELSRKQGRPLRRFEAAAVVEGDEPLHRSHGCGGQRRRCGRCSGGGAQRGKGQTGANRRPQPIRQITRPS
jgi:hypothetical protein